VPPHTCQTSGRDEKKRNQIIDLKTKRPIGVTIAVVLLLLLNGLGALYGGWNLMMYPDGSSLDMGLHWLSGTPFKDYLIPGIILCIVNGVCSICVLAYYLLNVSYTPLLIMIQGVLLTGWIVVQMILIQTINNLHLIFGSIGLTLFFLGWILKERPAVKHF